MADEHTNQPIVNWSHHTLTLNFCNTMANADMANDKEKFYKATIWFLRMLIAYLTDKERTQLENDLKTLHTAIATVQGKSAQEGAKNQILEMKEDFANRHAALGFAAFNRSGIVYVTDDGEVDFDKLALDKVQKIIQTPFGTASGLEKAINKELGKP